MVCILPFSFLGEAATNPGLESDIDATSRPVKGQ